jgi:hypothetical protein
MRSAEVFAPVAVVLLAAASTACAAGRRTTVVDAASICRSAFPGRPVAAAFRTTVGEVRARSVGPARQPAASAWPSYGPAAPAAWCYVGADHFDLTVAGAVRAEPPVVFATGGFSPSASGPQLP